MERVAFLLEHTGARLTCLLNPESIVTKRVSGIDDTALHSGILGRNGVPAGSLLFNRGGFCEVDLDLVFDTSFIAGSTVQSLDVRAHTAAISALAENVTLADGRGQPPFIRFVWGKTWNIRAVMRSVSERLENFDAQGNPRRSWMRLKLLQIPEDASEFDATKSLSSKAFSRRDTTGSTPANDDKIHIVAPARSPETPHSADRIDLLAEVYYRDASQWRLIADANDLLNPHALVPGTILTIPSLQS